METQVKQKIELYKQEAESQASPECCCPGCQQEGSAYRAHDRRRRQFYVIVGNWVQRFFTTLIRWKCILCGTTFTFYPSFCVPYKRFVLADITRLSERYVEADEASYRSVVHCQGMAIGYAEEPSMSKQLSPSTVWRWLGDFGACAARLQAGLRLIQEKDPSLALHRQIRPVAPQKYRTEQRREQLQTGRFLLAVAEVFNRLFGQVIFPRLRNARL
jgi:hypothetical protein